MTLEEQLAESPELKEWYEAFTRTVEGSVVCPNFVPGWPDEEFDALSHSTYVETCRELLDDALNATEDGKDVTLALVLPTFQEWKDLLKAGELQDRDNLGFSSHACEVCGAFAGNRYAVTALPVDPSTNPNYYTYEVCGDCLAYIANGDLPTI